MEPIRTSARQRSSLRATAHPPAAARSCIRNRLGETPDFRGEYATISRNSDCVTKS